MNVRAFFRLGLLVAIPWVDGSFAQVFSNNAVGYVNIGLKPGLNFVAVQLIGPDNSIASIFKNIQGGAPDGLAVYVYEDGVFHTAVYSAEFDGWSGGAASKKTGPGDGVVVRLPGPDSKVLTIVGEVPQGTICTEIPHGYSLKSNVIPQSTTVDNLRLPGGTGDAVFLFNPVLRSFVVYPLDDQFPPFSGPSVGVGQAFWYYRAGSATTWCRTFFVNNPG